MPPRIARSFHPWPSSPGRNAPLPSQHSPAHRKKSAKNHKNHKNRTETTTGTLALHFVLAMFARNQLDLKRWNSMPNGRLLPSGRSNGCRNSCSAIPVLFIISVPSRSRTGLSCRHSRLELSSFRAKAVVIPGLIYRHSGLDPESQLSSIWHTST